MKESSTARRSSNNCACLRGHHHQQQQQQQQQHRKQSSRRRARTRRSTTTTTTTSSLGLMLLLLSILRCGKSFVHNHHARITQQGNKGLVLRRRQRAAMATNSRELRFFHRGSSSNPHHHQQHPLSTTATTIHYPHSLLDFASFDARTTALLTSSFFSTSLASSRELSNSMSSVAERTSEAVATLNSLLQQQQRRYFTSFLGPQNGDGNNNNDDNGSSKQPLRTPRPPQLRGYGPSIQLTDEERRLFELLRHVKRETHLDTTLRVAGGWVRDKLLATPEFQTYHKVLGVGGKRLTSKFQLHRRSSTSSSTSAASTAVFVPQQSSMGRQGTKVIVSNYLNNAYANDLCSHQCQQPVDIDIALDDMLGREFADHLNDYLRQNGEDTVSVGVVLKNPEKSKHLETATMKVESFWIDFVNLRAEEYTQTDSRIPDLMRIGSASEDAFRRDLTINSLFFNINTGEVEDWTGRGFEDLRKGVVATPLSALTTLWDDPLRVLRAIRFAARLRFTMDQELIEAALDKRVRLALAQKVSRERVGGEVDLMLRSPDPVGAMRLLVTLRLASTVFPMDQYLQQQQQQQHTQDIAHKDGGAKTPPPSSRLFDQGLELLKTAHDHLADCTLQPPLWCLNSNNENVIKRSSSAAARAGTSAHEGACAVEQEDELRLTEDSEARRLLWYAAFLKPLHDFSKRMAQQQHHQRQQNKVSRRQGRGGRQANRSLINRLLVDELKRPNRDAEAIERIMKAADDFTQLLNSGCDISAMMILLSDVRVVTSDTPRKISGDDGHNDHHRDDKGGVCSMNGRVVDSAREEDPVWEHAMEFRLLCSGVLQRVGPLWRAALMLSISEQLSSLVEGGGPDGSGGGGSYLDYTIEGDVLEESQSEKRQGIVERFDAFATAMQHVGLIGIWNEKPLIDGDAIRNHILTKIPQGPAFREVIDEQMDWLIVHPGASAKGLAAHLKSVFKDYV